MCGGADDDGSRAGVLGVGKCGDTDGAVAYFIEFLTLTGWWSRWQEGYSMPCRLIGDRRSCVAIVASALTTALINAQRTAIRAPLAVSSGNKAAAARRLGISRARLYEKMATPGTGS